MIKLSNLKNKDVLLILMLLIGPFILGRAYSLAFPTAHAQGGTKYIPAYFEAPSSWTISTTFTVDVQILDAQDVSAWQVKLAFDPYSLVILDIEASEFASQNTLVIDSTKGADTSDLEQAMNSNNWILCHSTYYYTPLHKPGGLIAKTLVGGTSFNLATLSGTGNLATITFGVWSQAENLNVYAEDALLLDSEVTPTAQGTIAIEIIP